MGSGPSQRGASIRAMSAVSAAHGTSWGQRISSRGMCMGRWGGSCHRRTQCIFGLSFAEDGVVAWTRRMWLGLRALPPAEKPWDFSLRGVSPARVLRPTCKRIRAGVRKARATRGSRSLDDAPARHVARARCLGSRLWHRLLDARDRTGSALGRCHGQHSGDDRRSAGEGVPARAGAV